MAAALIARMRRNIEKKFGDEIRFFKGLLDTPRGVGAVMPTSIGMARRMASVIDTDSGLPVLELGPGTGVITRAILERGVPAEMLHCIEYSPEFARQMRRAFPAVTIIEGDAFALAETLGPDAPPVFDCVISALPLLNFPQAMREGLIHDLLERIPPGRPVVQFSYGPRPPVRPGPKLAVRRLDFVLRNVPPAQIWLYTRPAS